MISSREAGKAAPRGDHRQSPASPTQRRMVLAVCSFSTGAFSTLSQGNSSTSPSLFIVLLLFSPTREPPILTLFANVDFGDYKRMKISCVFNLRRSVRHPDFAGCPGFAGNRPSALSVPRPGGVGVLQRILPLGKETEPWLPVAFLPSARRASSGGGHL